MPRRGFGNLIALPLQKAPREKGNSVFLNSDFQPFSDQWTYLFSIEKLTLKRIEKLVSQATSDRSILCVKVSTLEKDNVEAPWTLPPSGAEKQPTVNYPICKYHIVWIPKYRKKVVFEDLRKYLGEIFRELATPKECKVVVGHLMPDHAHILISIPPKHSVSQVVGFIKGIMTLHYRRVSWD